MWENPDSWQSFIFHGSGRARCNRRTFQLNYQGCQLSKMVCLTFLACLRAEILNFEVLETKVLVTGKVCLLTWNRNIPAPRYATEMFNTILKMLEPQDYIGIGVRLLLCSWRSWKIKEGCLSEEVSSLFFYPWWTFVFHDLGKGCIHLKPFSLSWPCPLISKNVSWPSVGDLRAEIYMIEVGR